MRNLPLALLFIGCAGLFFSFRVVAQGDQFVCTPCGSECDNEVYAKAGKCKHCGMELVARAAANVENLSPGELCARVSANPNILLLDVRSPGEFSGSAGRESYGHFRNAININITELANRIGELSSRKDDEIIVYCSHSHRSPRAAYLLSANGFKNVKNMSGGVSTIRDAAKDPCLSKIFVKH